MSTFLILAYSGFLLPIEVFADLSIAVASTMLTTSAIDLGINVSTTKKYFDTQNTDWFRMANRIRIVFLPILPIIGWIVINFSPFYYIGLGIGVSGVLNIWNGVRSSDQARQDYKSFMRSSFTFALLRGVSGFGALILTHNPTLVILGMYVLPILAVLASSSFKYVKSSFTLCEVSLTPLLSYAVPVYISQLSFVAIPYLALFIVDARFDDTATGTYSLIMTFSTPVSLLVYSLRSVLLPIFLDNGKNIENALWSRKGVLILILIWTSFMCGASLLGITLNGFYSDKYPDIFGSFILYFAGYSATALIGLFGISIHTIGVPYIGAIVNLLRVVITIPVLLFFVHTLNALILIIGLVTVLGEILLASILLSKR